MSEQVERRNADRRTMDWVRREFGIKLVQAFDARNDDDPDPLADAMRDWILAVCDD